MQWPSVSDRLSSVHGEPAHVQSDTCWDSHPFTFHVNACRKFLVQFLFNVQFMDLLTCRNGQYIAMTFSLTRSKIMSLLTIKHQNLTRTQITMVHRDNNDGIETDREPDFNAAETVIGPHAFVVLGKQQCSTGTHHPRYQHQTSYTDTHTPICMFRVNRRRRWLISKSSFSRQCVGRSRDTCSQLTWKSHSPDTHEGTFWPILTPAQTLYLHESEVCKMEMSPFDICITSSSVIFMTHTMSLDQWVTSGVRYVILVLEVDLGWWDIRVLVGLQRVALLPSWIHTHTHTCLSTIFQVNCVSQLLSWLSISICSKPCIIFQHGLEAVVEQGLTSHQTHLGDRVLHLYPLIL